MLFRSVSQSRYDLAEDINLLKEIDGAIAESELIALRKNINAILNIEQNCDDYLTPEPYLFALSEEISSIHKMDNQIELDKIINSGHSFPKIHLYQHRIAGKETIHQLYKDQLKNESDDNADDFSLADDDLFSDIQLALQENEIIAYRDWETDRKSTRLNSSHSGESRMPSSA